MKRRLLPVLILLGPVLACGVVRPAEDAPHPQKRKGSYAADLLSEYEERMADADTELLRFHWVAMAAVSAFQADEIHKARIYSQTAITLAEKHQGSTRYGDAVHHAHIARGLLALHDGYVELAVQDLLAAGAVPKAPVIGSFGPNMSLAKALLEQRQHREAVLSYLELCRRFWRMDDGRLDQWKAEIEEGRVPYFGANLFY